MPADTKTCECCGHAFPRPPGRTREAWERRRFCSKRCALLKTADEAKRFWAKVEKTDGCWLWRGTKRGDGRGRFKRNDRTLVYAYRFAYELVVGPIPGGLALDHLCDDPRCVNPAHLEPKTGAENTRRSLAGRPRPTEVRQAISEGHRRSGRAKAVGDSRRGVSRPPHVIAAIRATKQRAKAA